MIVEPSWHLALALVLLVSLALAWSRLGRLGLERSVLVAALRAAVQLLGVSLIIVAALTNVWGSVAFALVMFTVAVGSSAKRIEARRSWPWVALAMACGVLPVLAVIFLSGTTPFTGISIVPIAGIIIGNTMTGNTLVSRRAFASLREERGPYEAALSIGLERSDAIREVIHRRTPEALFPNLDQTRTVGLVTLPGAFVGVLLGGGTPVQAGAAQLMVLLGVMAAQHGTVVTAERFISEARLLPSDLKLALRP